MKTGVRIELAESVYAMSSNNIWHPLHMFLDDWLGDICQEGFSIQKMYHIDKLNAEYHIVFDSPEDALIVKLKDIPPDLSKFISIHESVIT